MGGACDDRVKTIQTIFVAEKFKLFGKKVFSANDSDLRGYFTRASYKMASSVQNPMLKVNYFL